jgi:hypothetical protein
MLRPLVPSRPLLVTAFDDFGNGHAEIFLDYCDLASCHQALIDENLDCFSVEDRPCSVVAWIFAS